jgi:hypothetical protein
VSAYRDRPPPKVDPGDLRVRITGPVAAIVIAAMLIASGGWLVLVLTKTLPVESGVTLLSHLSFFLFGSGVPLVQWFRAKRIRFDIASSDPPERGNDGGDG